MMKFVCNHDEEFFQPGLAFLIGFLQFLGGLASEVLCIVFLTNLTTVIDTLIRFVAFGSIAKIDNFFADALPAENKICYAGHDPINVTIDRRTVKTSLQSWDIRVCRFVYKTLRIIYCSYIFYFMPFTIMWLPYVFPSKVVGDPLWFETASNVKN